MLSGGLDIYGKPMVDACTFAVEEANAAGGLLGRQIELINYDPQSNIQLYTQFAHPGGAQGQGGRRAWRHHLGVARGHPAGARPLQDALFLQHALRGRRLRPQPASDTGIDAGADGGEAGPLLDEEMGQEGLHHRRRLQLRPDHLAMGEEIRAGRTAARCSSIDFFPLDVTNFGPTISEDPGGEAGFRLVGAGRRRAYLVLSPVGRGGHAPQIPMASTTFGGGQRAHRALARGMQRHAGLLQLFPGLENPDEQGVPRALPQALRRRLPQHHRARHGDLSGLLALGRGGEEGG